MNSEDEITKKDEETKKKIREKTGKRSGEAFASSEKYMRLSRLPAKIV